MGKDAEHNIRDGEAGERSPITTKSRLREYLSPGGLKPGEKKLVQKIDFFILTFCCLSYFLNYVSTLLMSLFYEQQIS
jgi:hypothetical protein